MKPEEQRPERPPRHGPSPSGPSYALRACGVLAISLAAVLPARPADEPPASTAVVTVTDLDGKETKVAGAKLTVGTRRLAWLADPKAAGEEKLGPLALKVREPVSTTLVDGVLTLVPVAHVESAKYDYEKLTVAYSLKGAKEPVVGTLQYKGLNTLGIADPKAAAKAAPVVAGVPGKAAVKAVAFPDAKPLPAPKAGTEWAVRIVQKEPANPVVRVRNLKVLYHHPDGTERLAAELPSRKGPAVPLDEKLARLEVLATDANTHVAAVEVEAAGGPERLVAVPLTTGPERDAATVVGLIGEVDVGYKLFPLHTIKSVGPAGK